MIEGKQMINDAEMLAMIERVTKDYRGDLSHLYEAIGMLVAGRHFGWRVMRLVSGRRVWADATRLFGDPCQYMPEKGPCYPKSLGMRIIDKTGAYWEYIKRNKAMPVQEKRIVD
jgi:hypothetical protein